MPTLIPLKTIIVKRPKENGGQSFAPAIGEPFNFTDEEADGLVKSGFARAPVNETPAQAPAPKTGKAVTDL